MCLVTTGLLCLAHALVVWIASDGPGLLSRWPIPWHDHPVHFHSSTLAPRFFEQSGTNAGYDPYFMAGYAKSVIFPQSSTLYDAVAIATGGRWPAQSHKLTVYATTALLPVLFAAAGFWAGLSAGECLAATICFLLFVWTDGGGAGYPLNFALYGMNTFLVSVPLGLAALAAFIAYLKRGGRLRWVVCLALTGLLWMVHLASPLVFAPAAALAYFSALREAARPIPRVRHLAIWILPVCIAVVNAWWWAPAVSFWSERGETAFMFHHPESVESRLWAMIWDAPLIQTVLLAGGLAGFAAWWRRDPVTASGFAGFACAGFAFGYLAGGSRALDFLQPGRQTYAWHSAAALGSGVALAGLVRAAAVGVDRPARRIAVALLILLVGFRVFGPELVSKVRSRVGVPGQRGLVSSEPPPRLKWLLAHIESAMQPGERLLYEEGGFDIPGEPDPYQGGRFSGLLPFLTGVEVLGGPYLHVSLRSNFTQFGEGRLFTKADWGRDDFVRYATIYRPSAMVCWSPQARAFCDANPDLIEILARDEKALPRFEQTTGRWVAHTSRLYFARVRGFSGAASAGEAVVRAGPGRIEVSAARPSELDQRVVLRYHYQPQMQTSQGARIVPVPLADDPVPFIGLLPPPDQTTLVLSPWPRP